MADNEKMMNDSSALRKINQKTRDNNDAQDKK